MSRKGFGLRSVARKGFFEGLRVDPLRSKGFEVLCKERTRVCFD